MGGGTSPAWVLGRGPSLLLGSELNLALSQAGDDRRRQASEGERMGRAVTWEGPRNTLDEPKACELEGGFVKVGSFQTYCVTLGLGPVKSPL